MRFHYALIAALLPVACSSSSSSPATPGPDGGGGGTDAADAGTTEGGGQEAGGPATQSKIEHLVIIVQENHTFDTYFGKYCTAATGSNPTCTTGPSCCEAAPATDPSGATPVVLDDDANSGHDPIHEQACELQELNGGKMDQFAKGPPCSDPRNVAYADPAFLKTYTDLAAAGALADRYFQPIAGQSSSNDMYLARANFVFTDNEFSPSSVGSSCKLGAQTQSYSDQTIADLLVAKGVPWAWYAEGYKAMVDGKGTCPQPPPECKLGIQTYPCIYDPGDVPFQYYASLRDNPTYMKDYAQLGDDLKGSLASVVYVKGYGFHSEHPGYGTTITAGTLFVKGVIDAINGSSYAPKTLILLTYDEGGGFFDHVRPPPAAVADGKPYGTRVPMIAIGPFAKKNAISHVVMEHSSVVKFIEWNWLGGTGQLGMRDKEVNNMGSLLDPAATGTAVPEN
jgi:phospholipase C